MAFDSQRILANSSRFSPSARFQSPTSSTSQYPEFSLPYQNSPRDQAQGHTSGLDAQMDSPLGKQGAPRQRSASEISAAPSIASFRAQRMSNSSRERGNGFQQRNESIDESDEESPSSSRGIGLQGSDECRQMTGNSLDENGDPDAKDDNQKVPSWSELKTKAGKERKRLPLACIACRRKKIRCSGEKPACKHCLRSRIPCVYKVTARKAAPRTDYMTMLDKRLKRMEERVIKIIPNPDVIKMSIIGRSVVKPPSSQAPKAGGGTKKRIAEEAFGTELEEWLQTGTNKGNTRQPSILDQVENGLLTEGAESLPSKELQEHLSEVFFDCLYGQSYHVLHKPSFMRRLRSVECIRLVT